MPGLAELAPGNRVTLALGRGKFAGGVLSGTIGAHLNSVRTKPPVLGHG